MAEYKFYKWPEPRTYVYKRVNGIDIEADVYLNRPEADSNKAGFSNSILLYIHGGGWVGGRRTAFPRPLFYEFLTRDFVVVSIDYRLLPECDFVKDQLADITDVETWVREELPHMLREEYADLKVKSHSIIVAGSSAGAHLASLTPKLWETAPIALILAYGPTDMLNLPYLEDRPFGDLTKSLPYLPKDIPPELLRDAVFLKPVTNIPLPKEDESRLPPRRIMILSVFRDGLIGEFLINGLGKDRVAMPVKGLATEQELKAISPLHFSQLESYPPTYQYIGDKDEIFHESHVLNFAEKLHSVGVRNRTMVVKGETHGFDMRSELGDPAHLYIIKPAVEWVLQHA